MMYWYRVREESLNGCTLSISCMPYENWYVGCAGTADYIYVVSRQDVPSSIPKPDRNIGTIDIVDGKISVVVNSYPNGVLLFWNVSNSSTQAANCR
jgi:hypothetical protein